MTEKVCCPQTNDGVAQGISSFYPQLSGTADICQQPLFLLSESSLRKKSCHSDPFLTFRKFTQTIDGRWKLACSRDISMSNSTITFSDISHPSSEIWLSLHGGGLMMDSPLSCHQLSVSGRSGGRLFLSTSSACRGVRFGFRRQSCDVKCFGCQFWGCVGGVHV